MNKDNIESVLNRLGFSKIDENKFEYTKVKQIVINNQHKNVVTSRLQLEYIGEGEVINEYPLYGYHLWDTKNHNKKLIADIWIKDENDFLPLININ